MNKQNIISKITKYTIAIVIILFYSKITIVKAQTESFYDHSIGLSNSLINQLTIDPFGRIWVATDNGINIFDGHKFHTINYHAPKTTNSIILTAKGEMFIGTSDGLYKYNFEKDEFSEVEIFVSNTSMHPYISAISQDKNGTIWIATSGIGLLQMTEDMTHPYHNGKLNSQLCSVYLQTIFCDSKGRVWIGSYNSGISVYNPTTGTINNFNESSSKDTQLPDNDIATFCEDTLGNIYAGCSKGGLIKFSDTNIFKRIPLKDDNQLSFSVKSLHCNKQGKLLVGTDGNGLKIITENETLETFAPSSSPFDFSKSKIHSIIEDADANIWLGIYQKGIFVLTNKSEQFENYGYKAFGNNSIGGNSVGALAKYQNYVWIGTDGDGIYIIDRITDKITHLDLYVGNRHIAPSILSLYNQNDKYMWIGTFADGLIKLDIQSKKIIKIYYNYTNNPYNLTNDKVSSINKADNESIWLTTFGGNIGIFNTKTEKFNTDSLPTLLNTNQINTVWSNNMVLDQKHNIWIASYNGLVFVDSSKTICKEYNTKNSILPSNTVNCVAIDNQNNIWAGTTEGIFFIDSQTKETKVFTQKDGLSDNMICSIVQDHLNYIWISTHNGLSQYNPKSKSFNSFTTADGLQSNEFSRMSFLKDNDGFIWFGGIKGVTKIKSDSIVQTGNAAPAILSDILINGRHINFGDKNKTTNILNKPLPIADTITIREQDKVFIIGLATTIPARKKLTWFKYKMVGFDKQWKFCPPDASQASYTNLNHGTYTFQVISVFNEIESEPTNITVIITPPWYKTWWAYLIYIFVILSIIGLAILVFTERINRKQAETIAEMKMQFFINISHEIRTPLTLIIDPLEKLLQKGTSDAETSRLYKIMQVNGERIYRLINQLLDLRKIDKGQIIMKFGKTEMRLFVDTIIESCKIAAENKELEITTNYPTTETYAWIDPESFEKILLNLLSNAFKYTPIGGKVDVNITTLPSEDYKEGILKIIVSDTGIGLAPEDIDKIFQRFYQVKTYKTRHITGTGVGLHLAKYLVEMHKGKLYAQNRTDTKGSRFIIEIPLGNNHLPKQDLVTDDNIIATPTNKIPLNFATDTKTENTETQPNKQSKSQKNYKVMIVDDEDGIREYMTQELNQYCNTSSYKNGKEAFNNLIAEKPDLIISDIMMPEMDGITFCKKVKRNAQTSHIPVILLTALDNEANKTQGIEIGADMYIVKPFNSEFIKIAIKNLIENRRKVVAQATHRADNYQIENIKMKSSDEILMQKIMQIIKDNISRRDLNVEMLADSIGISRVHLHRKLKEITGLSARDFIKNIRMKQASYLLSAKSLNVSEVAYAVGYSNPAHFSASFKSFFGISPMAYIQNAKENNTEQDSTLSTM